MNIGVNWLSHCVCRLKGLKNDGTTSIGTGFFFAIHDNGESHVPILITNRHVIDDCIRVEFNLSELDENGDPVTHELNQSSVAIGSEMWFNHPNPEIDLCATLFGHIGISLRSKKERIVWKTLNPKFIPSEDDLKSISSVEEVIMVGYPMGLWDSHNNMPIFRKGITATHPRLLYNGKNEFLIDIAAFPGSSGSPVFLYKEGMNIVNSDRSFKMGVNGKFFLAGVLYAGPMYSAEGRLEIAPVPTSLKPRIVSDIPTNLGIVISSSLLKDFENIFPNPHR